MKKVIIAVLLIALALAPVMAKSTSGTSAKESIAVGLNLGSCSGLGIQYGMGDFDLLGSVGFGTLSNGVSVEAGAFYKFSEIKFGDGLVKNVIDCKAGVVSGVSLGFDPAVVSVPLMGAVGLEYQFKGDIPLTVYGNLGAGVGLTVGEDVAVGLAMYFGLGGLYRF